MGKSISYHTYLIESLKNHERAEGYLEAALEENDLKLLQKAVKNVIEALGERPDLDILQKAKQLLSANSVEIY